MIWGTIEECSGESHSVIPRYAFAFERIDTSTMPRDSSRPHQNSTRSIPHTSRLSYAEVRKFHSPPVMLAASSHSGAIPSLKLRRRRCLQGRPARDRTVGSLRQTTGSPRALHHARGFLSEFGMRASVCVGGLCGRRACVCVRLCVRLPPHHQTINQILHTQLKARGSTARTTRPTCQK